MTDQVQQVAEELTPEQQAQQAQMQAAMQQQQQQLQNHINAEIQKGVQHYNLDVQRLTIAAQGLEALANIETSALSVPSNLRTMAVALRLKFEEAMGIYVNPVSAPSVSCETTEDIAAVTVA